MIALEKLHGSSVRPAPLGRWLLLVNTRNGELEGKLEFHPRQTPRLCLHRACKSPFPSQRST